ncbi:MAG: hypothetical protein ABIJ08_04010 [Nanoarchaeota archaeon]
MEEKIERLMVGAGLDISEKYGNNPRFVFISDDEHSQRSEFLPSLNDVLTKSDGLFLEGETGKLRRIFGHIYLTDCLSRKMIDCRSADLGFFSDSINVLDSLLKRGIHIEYNDDPKNLPEHKKAYILAVFMANVHGDYLTLPQFKINYDKCMELREKRSDYMTSILLCSRRQFNVQIVGSDHLNGNWYDGFYKQGKSFITLARPNLV